MAAFLYFRDVMHQLERSREQGLILVLIAETTQTLPRFGLLKYTIAVSVFLHLKGVVPSASSGD